MIRPAPRSRGFTLLELVVVVLVFSVLVTLLLARLSHYQEMAEKAAMESTLRTIKTGLQVRLAELIITNHEGEATTLEAEDPTRWLDTPPPNYGGAYRGRRVPGTWYFDARERHLVYVVNTGNRLEIDREEGGSEIRFRVRLVKNPVKLPGGPLERTSGVLLAPVYPYRWP
jgi:prepilin-type N-terminal cleavage/methylation domain-containing protein